MTNRVKYSPGITFLHHFLRPAQRSKFPYDPGFLQDYFSGKTFKKIKIEIFIFKTVVYSLPKTQQKKYQKHV